MSEDRRNSKLAYVVAITAAILGASSSSELQAGPFFVGLGDLAGGSFYSEGYAISADGSTVVGNSGSASGTQAFRWTAATGMVGLGDLPGGFFESRAFGVSADKSVIVGVGRSASGYEAFHWSSASGMVGLGDLPGGFFDMARSEKNVPLPT